MNDRKWTTRGTRYCAVSNCHNATGKLSGVSFFRFPKDHERCKQWILNSGRPDLLEKPPMELYKTYSVCGYHFETSCFMNAVTRNRLVWNAVPTLFGEDNLNKPGKELPVKNTLPATEICVADHLDSTVSSSNMFETVFVDFNPIKVSKAGVLYALPVDTPDNLLNGCFGTAGDSSLKKNLDDGLTEHEECVLKFLVNEYLQLNNLKLTSCQLKNEDPLYERWRNVSQNASRPPELVKMIKDYFRRQKFIKDVFENEGQKEQQTTVISEPENVQIYGRKTMCNAQILRNKLKTKLNARSEMYNSKKIKPS